MPKLKMAGGSGKSQPRSLRITERQNPVSIALDRRSTLDILRIINSEDQKVAPAVARVIPKIGRAVDWIARALASGGRLVYLGAGTSGRLGLLDAAECFPTFGTEQVIGIMAGGPQAMFRAVEGAEDDPALAVADLRRIKLNARDVLVGISASGRTPYTIGGLGYARRIGARAVALTCNPNTEMSRVADLTIAPVPGPEVLAGSTRMKAGTAQKLVLNMLSTASMVRTGRVFSNRMIDVQLTNAKLRKRAEGILMETAGVSAAKAFAALRGAGGKLPVATLMLLRGITRLEAERLVKGGVNIAALVREARSGAQYTDLRGSSLRHLSRTDGKNRGPQMRRSALPRML